MRLRTGIAGVLVAAMAAFGVGCTGQPPATEWEAQNQAVGIGNFIFLSIYLELCRANYGVCPFPIAPTLPASPAPAP